jgi:hypothetical protein
MRHSAWFLRTDKGLAFTQQAWPGNPKVIVFESFDEVEDFVHETSEAMKKVSALDPQKKKAVEARIESFKKAVWSAWSDS